MLTRRHRTIAVSAFLALGALLISPVAWSCGLSGVASCQLSACPMSLDSEVGECHQAQAASCKVRAAAQLECCDAPVDLQAAAVDTTASWRVGLTSPRAATPRLELPSPERAIWASPDDRSRLHPPDRYLFFASFLL